MLRGAVFVFVVALLILPAGLPSVLAQEQPRLRFTVTVPTGWENEYAAMLIIKDSLARHGIQMDLAREDSSTVFSKLWSPDTYRLTYEQGGHDAAAYNWYWRPEDQLFFSSFTPRGFPPAGWNEWVANNAVIDEMLLAATSTYDKAERAKYYYEFTKEWQRDPPFIPLYYFDVGALSRAEIENFDPFLWTGNAEEWRVTGKTEEDFVTVRFAIPYMENLGLNPWYAGTSGPEEYSTVAPVYPQLLKSQRQPDGTFAMVPDLAESFEVSQDGLMLTFRLKQNLNWSDGTPFTSRDVKVTYEGVLDPATGIPALADLAAIQTIETPDDYTVNFKLSERNALVIAALGGYIGGGILPAHVFERVPHEKWRDVWSAPEELVTLGSYKIVEKVPNERTVLEANVKYYKGKPFVDRIEVVVIPEYSTAIAALKKGEVDILDAVLTNRPEFYAEYPTLKDDPSLKVSLVTWSCTAYLGFNLDHPILTNRYVRLAIANLIPIDTVIQDVLKGHGKPASGPIWPGSWAYSPDFPPMAKYDPEKAEEFLTMAGLARRVPESPVTLYVIIGTTFVAGLGVGAGVSYLIRRRRGKAPS